MIIDCHCDALSKMWLHQVDFDDDSVLDVNYQKWMQSPVKVQCFAIYIPEHTPTESKFAVALHMVDLFFEKIIKPFSNIRFVQTKEDIESLKPNEKGAMLTLEGLDCIGADLYKLRILLQLGVKMIGMSWNHANLAVDGIEEPRGSGISSLGRKVIELANQHKIWIDLAHISEQGFDEAVELSDHLIVSHANSRSVCAHSRNLTEQQVRKITNHNGLIGVTFVQYFVTVNHRATIDDLLRHISYFISVGAEDHLVFGSDFDGTDQFVENLSSINQYHCLQAAMKRKFPASIVEKISYQNFINHFPE
ncbi:dipeptidase [Gracilibacillus thailandensis]|uniref:Membrane dipeptidase n=1 Tax=Gracilibacillus thailandensis TaxID=563735 RepID=A0A6N7QWY1_9BACI|nr:membrane dipeptidase [Gracilibacillus thailandensis]MRI65395.1 membrane dipeptidase [Gracilibacillus thailandensis]